MLAQHCGEAGVNILGLQIFPGIEAVTDELVLRTPDGWGLPELAALVEGSGGVAVSATPCTEAALTDQPTRYVQAARTILAQPASFPEVVALLFDAEAEPAAGSALGPVQDVMDMTVGDVQVQVRRTAPFTGHRARPRARWPTWSPTCSPAAASGPLASAARPPRRRRLHPGVRRRGRLGHARSSTAPRSASPWSRPEEGEPGVRPVTPAGRPGLAAPRDRHPAAGRRGPPGARARGAAEIVLTTRADNQAVLPMVLAAGLRGRIRMAADVLTVRVAGARAQAAAGLTGRRSARRR